MDLSLPKRENLFKTTWEDSLSLYYTPFIKNIYLHRFKMAVALIGNRKYRNLLDLGFGCGIFLKELSSHTQSLYGVDVHENIDKVQETAKREGFLADLRKASIFSLPFAENTFECIMAMSVLEHLTELDKALFEIRRIASPQADIILGFPIKNVITDLFFKVLGYSAQEIHPSDHRQILQAIKRNFKIVKIMKFPRFIPDDLGLYFVVKSQKC